jgi:hypothetical protein
VQAPLELLLEVFPAQVDKCVPLFCIVRVPLSTGGCQCWSSSRTSLLDPRWASSWWRV